jgi:tetratricopeptide (TPR) repeat protein
VSDETVRPEDLSRDAALAFLPRDARGRPTVGGIPLVRRLGRGGMGAVYFAVHPRLQLDVAVKILPPDLAEQEPRLAERFLAEARLAASVSSDHLVRVLDVNVESGTHYLVMEFVAGESAGALVKRGGPLAERDALDIIRAATRGLAAAHGRGIVHRDVKPENILVPAGQPARAKLADLGLAKPENASVGLTMSHVAMGTPGYMAPEQAEDAKRAGPAADVFSMGAALYALLAGRAPFRGPSLMMILRDTATRDPDPLPAGVSGATRELVARCLAKEPSRRPRDGAALLAELAPAPPVVAARPEPDAASVFAGANRKAEAGDLAGAVAEYGEVIAREPRRVMAWCNRANALVQLDRLDGAISDATEALRLDPQCGPALAVRGLARHRKGDLEGAIADYTAALAVAPDNALVLNNRAEAFARKGRKAEAVADLRRALEVAPEGWEHRTEMEEALRRLS